MVGFLKGLPGSGSLVYDTEVPDGNLDRKMAFYLYRDTYEGPKAEEIVSYK